MKGALYQEMNCASHFDTLSVCPSRRCRFPQRVRLWSLLCQAFLGMLESILMLTPVYEVTALRRLIQ